MRWIMTIVLLFLATPAVVDARSKTTTKRVKTARFHTAVLEGAPEGAPDGAVWRKMKTPDGASGMTLERISGCHGERNEARTRVLAHKGVVAQPLLRGDTFEPGVLDVNAIGDAACVTDDEPTEMDQPYLEVLDFDFYMASEVFECNCGGCHDPASGKYFDEGELDDLTTPEHKAAYERYRVERTAEVAKHRTAHAGYSANHNEWVAKRAATLPQSAIRIHVTAEQSMPAGRIAVYSYNWTQYSFCGDTSEATRGSMNHWTLERPALAAGQTLEVWVDGVDLHRAWGLVVGDDDAALKRDIAAIEAESERRMQTGEGDMRALPTSVEGRAAETSVGAFANVIDECCSC